MKTRISSIVIGVSHLVIGGYLGHAAGKFGAIYADLYSPDAALPLLTRIVLALAPVGWVAFGIVAAAFLIGKDAVPSLRKIPNWPFALSLLAVGMAAVIALFLPLVITIEAIGNT
jgi:hypothetical protein